MLVLYYSPITVSEQFSHTRKNQQQWCYLSLPTVAFLFFTPSHRLAPSLSLPRCCELLLAGSSEEGKPFYLKLKSPASTIYPFYCNHHVPRWDAKVWLACARGGLGGWEMFTCLCKRSASYQGELVLVAFRRGQTTTTHIFGSAWLWSGGNHLSLTSVTCWT